MSIISLGFVDTKLTITEDMDNFQPRQGILDIVGEKENANCNSSDPFFPFPHIPQKGKLHPFISKCKVKAQHNVKVPISKCFTLYSLI